MKTYILYICSLLFIFSNIASVKAADPAYKIWNKAFKIHEKAQEYELDGQVEKSLATFKEALSLFEQVNTKYPDWNKTLIKGRIKLCNRKIKSIQGKISAATNPKIKSRPIFTPIPKHGTHQPIQKNGQKPIYKKQTDSASSLSGSVAALENQLNEYRSKYTSALLELSRLKKEHDTIEKVAFQVQGLLKEKKDLIQKYTLLKDQLDGLKERKSKEGELLQKFKTHFENERINTQSLKEELKVLMKENVILREAKKALKTQKTELAQI